MEQLVSSLMVYSLSYPQCKTKHWKSGFLSWNTQVVLEAISWWEIANVILWASWLGQFGSGWSQVTGFPSYLTGRQQYIVRQHSCTRDSKTNKDVSWNPPPPPLSPILNSYGCHIELHANDINMTNWLKFTPWLKSTPEWPSIICC